MPDIEPGFETIDGYRYASWRSLVRPQSEVVPLDWVDIVWMYAALFGTVLVLTYLIAATVTRVVSFELGIAAMVLVVLGGHGLHIALMLPRGRAKRNAPIKRLLSDDGDLEGVPCVLQCSGPDGLLVDRGLVRVSGSSLEFHGSGCRASFSPRDLIETQRRTSLEFKDPVLSRRILLRFGGFTGKEQIKPAAAAARIQAELAEWRRMNGGQPSVFPPARRRRSPWLLRFLAVRVPIAIVALLICCAVLDQIHSVVLSPLPRMGLADWIEFSACLVFMYAVALLVAWYTDRSAVAHNQRVDTMVSGTPAPTSLGSVETEELPPLTRGTISSRTDR